MNMNRMFVFKFSEENTRPQGERNFNRTGLFQKLDCRRSSDRNFIRMQHNPTGQKGGWFGAD